MAINSESLANTLTITVETGTNADGSSKYGTRSVSYINPALSDADAYSFAAKIGTLQAYPVASIMRVRRALLTNA